MTSTTPPCAPLSYGATTLVYVTDANAYALEAQLELKNAQITRLKNELTNVLEWAKIERAPLRAQEIASIERALGYSFAQFNTCLTSVAALFSQGYMFILTFRRNV